MNAVLELENVKKSYGSHTVLKGVDLKVKEGEVYGLLGPNGAGKTTLFQTILGLLQQDAGVVRINGKTNRNQKKVKKEIGYLPSDISFYENRNAIQNLEFFSDLAETDPNIHELLELVDLEEDKHRNVGEYSTGMKKRLGIAQALIKEPSLAIFDEPTTGLDPEGKNQFRKQVEKINKEKDMTIVISSHITGEISPLCDRFGILTEGIIKVSGTKEELIKEAGSAGNLQLKVQNPDKAISALEELDISFKNDGNSFEIKKNNKKQQIIERLVSNNVDIKNLSSGDSTLESLYLELTSD